VVLTNSGLRPKTRELERRAAQEASTFLRVVRRWSVWPPAPPACWVSSRIDVNIFSVSDCCCVVDADWHNMALCCGEFVDFGSFDLAET